MGYAWHRMTWAILALGICSFLISWAGTALVKRWAIRVGFVDKPGHRKIHDVPKALGGGIAIFWAVALPIIGVLLAAWLVPMGASPEWKDAALGVRTRTDLAVGVLLAMLLMHLMGLVDDRKALGPYIKLFYQLLVTTLLVALTDLRAMTFLGTVPSIAITVLWITAITNAFNFLDNMDGLSAGVAAVCTLAFIITALLIGQTFVAAMLAVLLGALIGFLCFNFPPATIFMGDSGSLIVGFLLGVLTVRTQYLPEGVSFHAGWYATLAPVIVLAVPLYDLIVVSIIRVLNGKSPFTGDTNHFSHRLVRRGMSRRTAVLCLYLITAATAMAAILLTQIRGAFAAQLVFVQTLLVLGVVALLEQHPLPQPPESKTGGQ